MNPEARLYLAVAACREALRLGVDLSRVVQLAQQAEAGCAQAAGVRGTKSLQPRGPGPAAAPTLR